MYFKERANHTTMQTSTTNTKIESRVTDWGFYGTIRSNLNLSEDEAAELFDRAVRFTAKRLDMKLDAARRFLDSKLGRHLADVCHRDARVEDTLAALYPQWKRDVREIKRMAINTTDEAFYC